MQHYKRNQKEHMERMSSNGIFPKNCKNTLWGGGGGREEHTKAPEKVMF
jgi:hypothetical protein